MPIYEYECNACNAHLEVTQSMKDPPLKTCNTCGKDTLQKLISRSAFHLKGGGWYSDLYSSTSGDKKADTKSSDSSAASTPAATTTTAPSSSGSEKKAEGGSAAA